MALQIPTDPVEVQYKSYLVAREDWWHKYFNFGGKMAILKRLNSDDVDECREALQQINSAQREYKAKQVAAKQAHRELLVDVQRSVSRLLTSVEQAERLDVRDGKLVFLRRELPTNLRFNRPAWLDEQPAAQAS